MGFLCRMLFPLILTNEFFVMKHNGFCNENENSCFWLEIHDGDSSWIQIKPFMSLLLQTSSYPVIYNEKSSSKPSLTTNMNSNSNNNNNTSTVIINHSESQSTIGNNFKKRILLNEELYPMFIFAFHKSGYIQDVTKSYVIRRPAPAAYLLRRRYFCEKYLNGFHLNVLPYVSQCPDPTEEKILLNERDFLLKLDNSSFPTSESGFKQSDVYCLSKDIRKYQILRNSAKPISFFKTPNNLIYSRDDILEVHSREKWKQLGLSVKDDEHPAKIIKSSKLTTKIYTELFGYWQTEAIKPQVAKDGIVPKNDRGQVDYFHEKMLPLGTCYMCHPGIKAIAKKLNVDYAPAMIGFVYKNGKARPHVKGIVVCAEFEELLLEGYMNWKQNHVNIQGQKERSLAIKNWKTLVRVVLKKHELEQNQ